MKKITKSLLPILALVAILLSPALVLATTPDPKVANSPLDKLNSIASGNSGPYQPATSESLSATVGQIISVALGLLGMVFIILIVIGGYKWMMAGGNEEDVKAAQARIQTAIIGLIITISAYALWNYIFMKLIQ